MRVCLLTYRGNPYCGGQGVYVMQLARELARLGHEVHCVTGPPYPHDVPGVTWHKLPGVRLFGLNGGFPPHDDPLSALHPLHFYEWAAVQTGVFPEMTAFSLRAFGAVRRLLQRQHFDIIHDNQTLGWGLLPLRALGVPLLATIHHPLTIDRQRGFEPPTSFREQFGKVRFYPLLMQRYVARRLQHVLTVSHAAAGAIVRDFGVPAERLRVVYNGVDSAFFRPLPHIRPVPGRVLFVGNIQDRNKGGRYLLRAMQHVRAGAHLVVVTGGVADRAALEAELASLGIRERVTVYEKLSPDALLEMYATAEVAVSPSVFEGFGFPAAEAMACGLPLVAAQGGALPEVVGDAGLLVPPRDPQALADAINRLLDDPALRATLGERARARIVERFRWERAARETVAVYEEVVHAHRGL